MVGVPHLVAAVAQHTLWLGKSCQVSIFAGGKDEFALWVKHPANLPRPLKFKPEHWAVKGA